MEPKEREGNHVHNIFQGIPGGMVLTLACCLATSNACGDDGGDDGGVSAGDVEVFFYDVTRLFPSC